MKMNTKLFNVKVLLITLTISLAAPSIGLSKFIQDYHAAKIEIITDNGDIFPIYPTSNQYLKNEYRAYLEAVNGKNYTIRIHNRSNHRLGFVIAVDGRNIISGKKSYLKHTENMYILNPYQTQTYSGWRTSSRDIHRFYFTDSQNSYAEAFNDESAMGVIAIAIYAEKQTKFNLLQKKIRSYSPSPTNRSAEASPASDITKNKAGTGFGKHATSHAYRVHFNPKNTAQAKFFYKYEWRESLCHKKIIDCGTNKNRFWPHDDYGLGFAPYPSHYTH